MVNGLITYRVWMKSSYGGLYATNSNIPWDSQIKVADYPPTIANTNGVYSYLITRIPTLYSTYSGLIENRGVVCIHTDGVVRSEWAKILVLFVPLTLDDKGLLGRLHSLYQAPIIKTDVPSKAAPIWLSQQGLETHNTDVMTSYDLPINNSQEEYQVLKFNKQSSEKPTHEESTSGNLCPPPRNLFWGKRVCPLCSAELAKERPPIALPTNDYYHLYWHYVCTHCSYEYFDLLSYSNNSKKYKNIERYKKL